MFGYMLASRILGKTKLRSHLHVFFQLVEHYELRTVLGYPRQMSKSYFSDSRKLHNKAAKYLEVHLFCFISRPLLSETNENIDVVGSGLGLYVCRKITEQSKYNALFLRFQSWL